MAWKTKEEAKEYNDAYKAKNRDEINARRRAKYAQNPAKYCQIRKDWRNANPARSLQIELKRQAKERATLQNVPFNIEVDDIIVPEYCPVLKWIKLERNTGASHAHDASPTLDKIIPSLGYVKGNIVVISHRANVVKGNSSLKEIAAVADFYLPK